MAVKFEVLADFRTTGDPEGHLRRLGESAGHLGRNVRGSMGGISGAWRESTAAVSAFSPALAETAIKAGAAGEALQGLAAVGLTPVGLAALATVGTIGGVGLVLGEMAKTAVEVNAEIQAATRSIGAAISASFRFGAEGKDANVNYARSMEFAGDVVNSLQDRQMELGETMPTLAEGYLKMIPAVERAGLGVNQAMELMEKSTFAAKALGMNAGDAYFQVQSLMETGMARGEFMKQLGIAGEGLQKLGARDRYDAIVKRMGELEQAGRAAAQSTKNVWTTTWDDIRDTVGITAKGMSDEIGAFVQDFSKFWRDNRSEIVSTLSEIASAGASALRQIREVFVDLGNAAMFTKEKLDDASDWLAAHPAIAQAIPFEGFGMVAHSEARQQQTVEKALDQVLEDYRAGKIPQATARRAMEERAQSFGVTSPEIASIIGERMRRLETTKPVAPPTPKVEVNIHGPITIQQQFRDQDPDRVAMVVQRDLAKLSERRKQSGFAPAFGF